MSIAEITDRYRSARPIPAVRLGHQMLRCGPSNLPFAADGKSTRRRTGSRRASVANYTVLLVRGLNFKTDGPFPYVLWIREWRSEYPTIVPEP